MMPHQQAISPNHNLALARLRQHFLPQLLPHDRPNLPGLRGRANSALLLGGNAHATFEQAVADLPAPLRNQAAPAAPYTIWQLVEHVRIAQADILDFA
ncbi:MAG: hypothetical protein WKG07_31710 [Hymenobacter sp.]